jgi:succinate-acetate transporter protein
MATLVGSHGSEAAVPAPSDVHHPEAALAAAMGDPAPLGLACFGITTLCLSVINAGWLTAVATPMVLALALPVGGGAQILAGMWAYRRGNTFVATTFSAYGAFWISFFLLLQYFVPAIATTKGAPADAVTGALGLYLFAWGIFTAYMLVAAFAVARAVAVVFALLTATFLVLAVGFWAGNSSTLHVLGGYLGILTGLGALYLSFADVTKATFKRDVVPT